MQKITFENTKGDTLTLSQSFPYLLENIKGIGTAQSDNVTDKSYQQDGENYYCSLLKPRHISFNVWVKGSTKQDLLEKRQTIIDVFNPNAGLGVLSYENDVSEWQINSSVTIGPVEIFGQMHNPLVKCYGISLFCPDPAWESSTLESEEVIGFDGGQSVPIILPLALGNQSIPKVISYAGALDAPLTIEFQGPAVMPKITKDETGETIEIEVDLLAGESLFIVTKPYDIDVYTVSATGVKQTAFNYVKPDSDYFQLTSGLNTLSYSASSGGMTSYVSWRDRFVGV